MHINHFGVIVAIQLRLSCVDHIGFLELKQCNLSVLKNEYHIHWDVARLGQVVEVARARGYHRSEIVVLDDFAIVYGSDRASVSPSAG